MAKIKYYRGATFKGIIQLRVRDANDPDKVNPFVIEAGSLVEVIFPGETAPVVLSTATPGEVAIVDTNLSTISFEGSVVKSGSLAIGNNLAVDVRITQGVSTEVVLFEKLKAIDIADIQNI